MLNIAAVLEYVRLATAALTSRASEDLEMPRYVLAPQGQPLTCMQRPSSGTFIAL